MDKKDALFPAGKTSFAPELTIRNGVMDIDFYKTLLALLNICA